MKPRVKIITGAEVSIPRLTICKLIMDEERIRYDIEVNTLEVARISRGHFNPATGFVMLFEDGTRATNHYGLVEWIEKNGLKDC